MQDRRRIGISEGTQFKVVIAGGGIAAVEAILALRRLVRERVDLELLAPNEKLRIPALSVAEPFGVARPDEVALADICRDLHVVHRRDTVQGVDSAARIARTGSGAEVPFDALLIAIGASPRPALDGALTYSGPSDNAAMEALLRAAEAGAADPIVFAVPRSIQWPLPVYELALLTADRLRGKGIGTELALVTHEDRPLELFGRRASNSVWELLGEVEIELVTGARAERVEAGGLRLSSGQLVPADRVVASPRLTVAPIEGIPQGPDGFIGTDLEMRVEGTPRTYAAGDATWFPVKQGGVAAQQADVAASTIASLINPELETRRFRPTLRGVLFTGGAPKYLRAEVGERASSSATSAAPLWWPPAKVAGRYLAPYLAKHDEMESLEDLEPIHGENLAESEQDHRDALELALAAADADARWHDYDAALRWLNVARDLNIGLPAEYDQKRREWEAATSQAPR